MNFEIVISHFCEKLDWIHKIKSIDKIIYEKGKGNTKKQNCPFYKSDIVANKLKIITLPNIGRESHTWLYHIVNNYNNLAEYTIFVQGNPLDHYSEIIETLLNLPNSLSGLFEFSTGCYSLCDVCIIERPSEWNRFQIFPQEVYDSFFSTKNKWFLYGCGAQYIVHKKCIINKPLDFYIDLYQYLVKQYEVDPNKHSHVPWTLERLWPSIFDSEDKYKCKSKKNKMLKLI
jgi:hypothetical protein